MTSKRSILYISIIILMFVFAIYGFNKMQLQYEKALNTKHTQESTKYQVDATTQGTRLMGQPIEITEIKTYQALNFNPAFETAELSYNISKAGFVNILVTDREDTTRIFRNLIDWQWRNQGINTETWDGKNDSNIIINPKLCRILIEAREAQDTTKKPTS